MAISDDSLAANRQAVESALLACVTPVQACRSIDLSFEQSRWERQALLRKVVRDCRRRPLKAHLSLLDRLEAATLTARGAKRLSAANSCILLASALPWHQEAALLGRLSLSQNASIRGQVFHRTKELSHRPLPHFIEKSWRAYRDYEATKLLIHRGQRAVVRRNFAGLEEEVQDDGALLGRLYLRLDGLAPATLSRLRSLNPLTYAYVCTRLGKRASRSLIQELLVRLAGTDEFGLAAWCCGEMGYRDLLKNALPLIDAAERRYEAERARFHASLGV